MNMKNALVKFCQAKKFMVTLWHIDQVFGHTLTHWPSVGHILHKIAAPKTPAVALCNCPGPRSLATTVSATTQLVIAWTQKTKIYTTGILVLFVVSYWSPNWEIDSTTAIKKVHLILVNKASRREEGQKFASKSCTFNVDTRTVHVFFYLPNYKLQPDNLF